MQADEIAHQIRSDIRKLLDQNLVNHKRPVIQTQAQFPPNDPENLWQDVYELLESFDWFFDFKDKNE